MKYQYYIIALIACAVTISMEYFDLFHPVEMKALDVRYDLRRDLLNEKEVSKEIVVIGIDDQSILELKQPFILWDVFFAEVIESLGKHQAKVIGLDLIWSKKIDDYVTRTKKERFALRRALLITKNKYKTPVVMGIGAASRKNNSSGVQQVDTSLPMKQFGSIVGRSGFGVVNTLPDSDNFIRQFKLEYRSVGQDGTPKKSANTDSNKQKKVSLPGFANRISAHYMGKKTQKGDEALLINYELSKTFKIVPFYDVLTQIRAGNDDFLTKEFKDKIVLMGVTNVSGDILPSPIAQETPGILIHAHAIDMLIHENFLSTTPIAVYIILSLVLSFLVVFYSSKGALKLTLAFTALLLIVFSIINLLLFDENILVPYVAVIVLIVWSFGVTYFYRFVIEEKSKKRLALFFKSYVNDQVVKDILSSDKPMDLEGKREKICILFCDIRSFTTYSESNPSEEVFKTLNEYFSAMTEAILENNGTVDKFIGDGLMAFFGAPLHIKNPTLSAVKAAVQMRKRLDELNAKWLAEGRQELNNGIGLHTGFAHIGNVGSDKKMDYTAIGDSVNIASRVEGVTKNLGSSILMTEDAQELVKNEVKSKPKGEVALKGRAGVFVHEVIELTGEGNV